MPVCGAHTIGAVPKRTHSQKFSVCGTHTRVLALYSAYPRALTFENVFSLSTDFCEANRCTAALVKWDQGIIKEKKYIY
jgi:hypothetical protein